MSNKELLLGTFLLLMSISSSVIVTAQEGTFSVEAIGANNFLDRPWDLLLAPDGHLWVTEREEAVVVRVNPTTGERDNLIKIAEASSTAGQDGLLGIALHDDFLEVNPFAYLSYTYLVGGARRQKIVRYTYSLSDGDGTLADPITLIDNLPSSNDHNSGRVLYGPDGKIYYSIGDQGGNQNANFCNPILSQELPTQAQIDQQNWSNYPGKILRLNIDGSIPDDNPLFAGVRSHIYSVGHRNPQGLVFGNSGLLYSDEHGPNTDDEVNIIYPGKNYGWPNVVGFQDNQAYDYCNWSSVANCENLNYSNGSCPDNATLLEESTFVDTNYQEPLFSMFAVTDDYDYNNPACSNSWICRPNVAPSSIGIYESDAIPSWNNSLLVTSLKRGRIYRLKLDEDGTAVVGDTIQHFYTQNRYRDIEVDPDGKTFYILTGQRGRTSDASGLNVASGPLNPGNILKFTLNESTAIDDRGDEEVIKLWPNPVSRELFLEINAPADEIFRGHLISLAGKTIDEYRNLSHGRHNIRLREMPPGLYMLRMTSQKNTYRRAVVVR